MLSSFTLECIDGALKKVQTITYSNGKTVRRIFQPEQIIPEEVRPVEQPIMHREEELYRYHFGLNGL
jgi:hypothetical protein